MRTMAGMGMGRVVVGTVVLGCMAAAARAQELTVARSEATVQVEPYAANVVRVTLSLRRDDALRAPGYGITAKRNGDGWSKETGASGDVLRSDRMVVTIAPKGPKRARTGTGADIAKFFNGSTPGVGLTVKTPDGQTLVKLDGWQMSVPNYKDGNADILYDRRPTDPPFFEVGATFAAPKDEHYYGLGQNQEGYLDRRGHAVRCAMTTTRLRGRAYVCRLWLRIRDTPCCGITRREPRWPLDSMTRRAGRRTWGRGFRSL